MANYASNDQIIAVAQSCDFFNSGGFMNSRKSSRAEQISCELCRHWDGAHCKIDVFDSVLTSLDQT